MPKLAAAIAALLSLSIHGSAVISGVKVERSSLMGYSVAGATFSREEAIDALSDLLDRIREQGPAMAEQIRRAQIGGSLVLHARLTSVGPRVEIEPRIASGTIHTLRADRALALGIVTRVLRDAGLFAQRDLDRGVVVVTG
jgi:hypothetical protein